MIKLRKKATSAYDTYASDEIFRNNKTTVSPHFVLDVLASSSMGNAAILDGCLQFDYGIRSKNFALGIKERGLHKTIDKLTCFITHEHSDHFDIESMLRTMVYDNQPYADIYVNQACYDKFIAYLTNVIPDYNGLSNPWDVELSVEVQLLQAEGWFDEHLHVIKSGDTVTIKKDDLVYKITAYGVKHSVDCLAFKVSKTCVDGTFNFLYAIDLCSLDGLPDCMFEHIALENNHKKSSETSDNLSDAWKSAMLTHLSQELFITYVYEHLSKDGVFNELHMNGNVSLGIEYNVNIVISRLMYMYKCKLKNTINGNSCKLNHWQMIYLMKNQRFGSFREMKGLLNGEGISVERAGIDV